METIPILNGPIPTDVWAHETHAPNGSLAKSAAPWEPWVQKIAEYQHLDDAWDGAGAKAPSLELVESAIGLAHLLRDREMLPPSRVVPGIDGTILFEWQLPDGTYAEIEVVRPLFAEVMVIEPGKPARHWTLPTE